MYLNFVRVAVTNDNIIFTQIYENFFFVDNHLKNGVEIGGHFLTVTKLNMFFEGIFLEIEGYGVGWRVAESCDIGDEYIKLCPENSSDFFVYLHALYFKTLSMFRIYAFEL